LQGAKYLFPLATIPYLVRILGPEKFGLVMFAQAFVQYFIFFTDYGFNFSATREIAVCREDKNKLAEIFSSVVCTKVIFSVFSFLVFGAMVLFFGKFRQEWVLYLVTFLSLFGNVFFFQWFFQGMEKMKYITILSVLAQILFVCCVFLFIKREQDYVLAALFYSFSFMLSGILSVYVVCSHFKLKFVLPGFKLIWQQIKNGYYIFLSQITSSLYTTSNVFILGLLTNNVVVGYYSAGEKLIKAVQAVFNPVSQTIFPHLSGLAEMSFRDALRFARKVTILSGILTFGISILIFMLAPWMVLIVLGDQYLPTVAVIRILAFLPFVCTLGNIFGTQIMINFGMAEIVARLVAMGGFFNVILALFLVVSFKQNGMAMAVFATESFIALSMFVVLEIKQLSPRKKWLKE
jgi:PST family polysaccharide transporter